MHVLWLCSWYPNEVDSTAGDFVERHALAAASFLSNLSVVAVFKNNDLKPGATKIVRSKIGNLTVHIGYYGPAFFSVIEKIHSYFAYRNLQRQLIREVIEQSGKPALLHVHVAMKAGLSARSIAEQLSIPYLITEHWTGYLPDAIPNIKSKGSWYYRLNKKILQSSSMLLPVSNHLGRQISKMVPRLPSVRVFNAVDTRLFHHRPRQASVFRFIHFSYLNHQKNPEGIITACEVLKNEGLQFECFLVGNESWSLSKMAEEKRLLDTCLFIMPAVPYEQVAGMMQDADVMVMFSRFENMPCVILEALCVGLPVISTRVGGIEEVIDDYNGILLPEGNVDALVAAMKKMMNERSNYDSHSISKKAIKMFGYNTIGEELADIYKQILASAH